MAKNRVISAVLTLKDKDFTSNARKSASAMTDFEKKTKHSQNTLQKFGKSAVGSMKKVAKGVVTAGATITALGAATFAATKEVTEGFDKIAKNSKKMGVTTDFYQELDYWSSQNGMSAENMEKSMKRLNQRVGQARSGNKKYSSALKELGVDMNALEKGTLTTEDAMVKSISSLSKMTNEQDKAALASELFGVKLAQEMMPALQDGSLSLEEAAKKAAELGIVIDEDTLKASEKFNDTWDDLTRSVSAFSKSAIAGVMPFFQKMMDYAIVKLPDIKKRFSVVFDKIGDVMSWTAKKIPIVTGALINMYEYSKPGIEWMINVAFPAVVVAVEKVIDVSKRVYSFIVDKWSLIGPVVAGLVASFTAFKIGVMAITAAKTLWAGVTSAVTVATAIMNGTLAISPLAWVALAIGAVVVAGIALYKNWDVVSEKATELWNKVKEVFGGIYDWGMEKIQPVSNFFQGLSDKFNSFKEAITSFTVPKWVSSIGGAIGNATSKVKSFFGGSPSASYAVGTDKVPRDMVAQVHKGEMIIPARQSKELRNQGITKENISNRETTNNHVATTSTSNKNKNNSNSNIFNINIDARDKSPEQFANEFIPVLRARLSNL